MSDSDRSSGHGDGDQDEHGSGSDHGNHGNGHGPGIRYFVDDEPEFAADEVMTPTRIMTEAGIDPQSNYLELLNPGQENTSYKDNPLVPIPMKPGMHFITKPTGPMPVSC